MREARSEQYLNNLDGLRFIAASAVIVHHLEQFKSLAGLPSYWETSFITEIGPQAVNFFFVLSGFLITYLLLKEFDATGRVGIKSYYLRRILRIWPLYYLTVLLGFFVLPNTLSLAFELLPRVQPENFSSLLAYFVFFLPNIALLKYPPVLGASQCWSLGVEEQFYIIWPLLIHWFRRTPLQLLFSVIFLKVALMKICDYYYNAPGVSICAGYLHSFALESMAAGGIAACWMLRDKLHPKSGKAILICAFGSLCAMVMLGYGISGVTLAAYSVAILLAAKAKPIGGIFYAPLQSIGKLSYGLYMLHTSAIMICLNILLSLHVDVTTTQASIYLYVGTSGLTFIFAYCSYKFFELPIMKVKNKIAKTSSYSSLSPASASAASPEPTSPIAQSEESPLTTSGANRR